jgi:hypothetical protein
MSLVIFKYYLGSCPHCLDEVFQGYVRLDFPKKLLPGLTSKGGVVRDPSIHVYIPLNEEHFSNFYLHQTVNAA